MPFIKILKPCHILGAERKEGEIVKDDNAAECRNLIGKKLAAALTPEEEAAEIEKEQAPAPEHKEGEPK